MREALAFLSLIALVIVGWNQSYEDHLAHLTGQLNGPRLTTTPKPVVRTAPTQGASGPSSSGKSSDRSWMWERTNMDKPYDQRTIRGR